MNESSSKASHHQRQSSEEAKEPIDASRTGATQPLRASLQGVFPPPVETVSRASWTDEGSVHSAQQDSSSTAGTSGVSPTCVDQVSDEANSKAVCAVKLARITLGESNSRPSADENAGICSVATAPIVALDAMNVGQSQATLGFALDNTAGIQPIAGAAQSVVGTDNAKPVTKDSANGSAVNKTHPQPASGSPVTKSGSDDKVVSPVDGSQSNGASQDTAAVPIDTNAALHTLAADPNMFNVANDPRPPTTSQSHGRAVGAADATSNAGMAAPALPPASPVINSAKLIQNMGQSEMRVGLRSPEFGNISISTSTTRDEISAQISLDHTELAKALAVHLPELQAKLGGNHAADVRVTTVGQGVGPDTASSGSSSSGSSDGSSGRRQQTSRSFSNIEGNGVSDRNLSHTALAMMNSEGGQSNRLDIRV